MTDRTDPARADAAAPATGGPPPGHADPAPADPAAPATGGPPPGHADPAPADPAAPATGGPPPGHADPADQAAPAPTRARRASDPGGARDDEAVSRFIEDFASALVEMGVPRMPARVFVALLTSDSGRLSAAELAATLRASPAAMSGAVRYLIQVGLVRRESEPGSRRHFYRVPDNVWDELIRIRDRLMARWTGVLREGIKILGADTPAGARVAESVRYFEFVSSELPLVIEKWRAHRAALDGQADPGR